MYFPWRLMGTKHKGAMVFFKLLAFLAVIFSNVTIISSKPSIAIIGGGIGGSSCSYFLRDLCDDDVNIDLYEKDEIGGRLATVNIGGREYEAGGSMIHPANLYMKNFSKLLGLKERERGDGRLAIYNGKELVFDGSRYEILMVLQLFYQYGWDIVRINRYVKTLLTNFERIYDHQDEGQAFTTVENLIQSMDPSFIDMMHVSTKSHMDEWGFKEDFINQLVLGGLRTNYGQGVNIHSFVGGVSMAGIEPGLWSVHGGNKLVAKDLVVKSGADVTKSKVTKITLLEKGNESGKDNVKYSVTSDNNGETKMLKYDYVIIAAPLFDNLTEIQFENFPKPLLNSDHHFHRTVATFVHGVPNASKFKVPNVHNFPDELLTNNVDLFFNSIGKHSPVDWTKAEGEKKQTIKKHIQKAVYKVFSQVPLTKEQIGELFYSYDEVKEIDWMAYPSYSSNESNLPPFELHQNMYYINAIELAASAMEMSVIGARNVALLLYNSWKGNIDQINAPRIVGEQEVKNQEL